MGANEMTPITRKELFLAKITGQQITVPEPITREEIFLASIAGQTINIPTPITRIEMYFAKLSGADVEIPTPITRIELFLAKAAGVEIETPTPITREEIFWANYKGIEQIIEGIPPLMFKSNGANLSNYRIYGNTVNGESVGDLITEGEHAGEYRVPVTVTNGTDTETTNIYLPEQIKMVGEEAEYIDYAEQKQHKVRKNLLQNTAISQTVGRDKSDPETYPGVTFTVNDDKSVTCNGASNQATYIYLCMDFIPEEGITYLYSGCPQNGGIMSYELDLLNPSGIIKQDIGNGITFDSTSRDGYLRVRLRIGTGYTCNNLTFYPMIRKADIEDDTYEPYIESAELDVTLPALPTFSGTNTLTVGTEVQPSSVEIKGRIQEVTP